MSRDKVYFVKFEGEITAVFPYLTGDYHANTMTCYAHVGQHGACDESWVKKCKKATPEEYNSLLEEIISIGYNPKILKKFPNVNSHVARYKELNTFNLDTILS